MTPSTPTRSLAVLLLAAVAATQASCSKPSDAGASALTRAKKREPTKVLVEPVVVRETVRRLETTTRVESEHHVEVLPRVSGVVTELLVEEGDVVEEGQALARLDNREALIARSDAENALLEAQAMLPRLSVAVSESDARLETAQRAAESARRDHERNLAISKGGSEGPQLLSAKDLDASRLAQDQAEGELATARLAKEKALLEEKAGATAVERAQLALERAELQLSFSEILAPFAGVIAERKIDVGDTVSSSEAAFTLTDTNRLRAIFYRPQRELRLFRGAVAAAGGENGGGPSAGLLEITARADGLPDKEFDGWIERVSPTVDPASGNFRVTARLETGAAPERLLPGMLVRLDIVTERHPNSLVVPKRAIRREGDRSVLFVVADGAAHQVEVLEGFPDGDDLEVEVVEEGALSAGDLVVVVGNRDLEEGTEVAIQGEDDAAQGTEEQETEEPGQLEELAEDGSEAGSEG
jgi:membrane fusion protein (multidrug efflux system)